MNTGDSMMKPACRCLLIAALVAASGSAFAQPAQTGTIQGEVKDATGGVMPGVTMTLISEERGFSRTTVTDENGRYVFPAVPIGNYSVEAVLQGFKTERSTNNLVETERTTAVSFLLEIGALTEAVQVIGDTPIVDPTTVTQSTRLTRDEFEKLPVGRSYQALIGAAPGVVGTGNVNALGALTSNNLFVIDAVDTTDPTTGTFGTNLNFEAIQEISVLTSAVGAEYGRAQGAIVNVVTKSGTNRFEGSAKYIFQNDDWNAQNSTKSETTGASLERVKFDKINPVYSFTGGGPAWKDRAWFFGTWELAKNTTPQRQTGGQIPEDYQQTTESKFSNLRGTVQLADGHTAWVKYYRSPTDGFVVEYHGAAATGEREALTAQDQTASNWAAQWSGVLGTTWAMEAAVASYSSLITVQNFEDSGRLGNAPVFNLADSKFYNGGAFDGFVDRPRQQFNVASNWFLMAGRRGHNVKVGYDFQNVESGAQFDFPNRQRYNVDNYIQATNTPVYGPSSTRRDYDSGASVSKGKLHALFARDKFELTDRISVEAGLRWDLQTGSSDVGVDTVNTSVLAPRLSASFDVTGDGKTLVTGSYGRYYASIIQGFSDSFANIPQKTNYDNYVWNGTTFVFANRVQLSGSNFQPDTDLKPYHMDEGTIGFQRQFGRSMGAGVRFITRTWGNLIEDTQLFNPDRSINRQVVNYDAAERTYRGFQLTAEKRFSNNWNAGASYTYSRTRGNHFGDNFTDLGNFLDSNCRTTADLALGTNGVMSCAEVANGANKSGAPSYDRPHNFKLNAAYVRPVGPVTLSFGGLTEALSKFRYEKVRSMEVLFPGTNTASGNLLTYFYNERGADPVEGMEWYLDASVEATWRIVNTNQAAFKFEIFNITDHQEKLRSNNTTWCNSDAGTGCAAARANYGKATARTSFRGGLTGTNTRSVRGSFIFRF
jgi:outer membrane receptor protein involved in Fe transport